MKDGKRQTIHVVPALSRDPYAAAKRSGHEGRRLRLNDSRPIGNAKRQLSHFIDGSRGMGPCVCRDDSNNQPPERRTPYAPTLSPRYSIAASVPPLPWGTLSAFSPTSMTPSVPKIIGALTWPIWAIRKAWPDRSPIPVPSTTPHFSLQYRCSAAGSKPFIV